MRHTLVNHFLEMSARRCPDRVALVHQGERHTYAELDAQADRLARGLAACGVGRGDRVVVFMDNSVEAVLSIFAALKAGAVFSVVHHSTKAERLEAIVRNCGARAIMTRSGKTELVRSLTAPSLSVVVSTGAASGDGRHRSFAELLGASQDGPPRPPSIDLDLASLIYTSGSTGRPKGVMLSHRNMVTAADAITSYLENTENDIILNALPLSFDYGLYQLLMTFKIGGTLILENGIAYPSHVINTLARERVTGFPGVPSLFAMLLPLLSGAKHDLGSVRYITSTAAVLPVSSIKGLQAAFPRARLYSMYGLTECKRVSYLPPEELDRRPTSVGRAMPNCEVSIVDGQGAPVGPNTAGELVVRGSNVMVGYWDLPEETDRYLRPGRYPGERVLYTGDLFTMDEEGFLYFVGRKDDMINCGGSKISPREVENVLYTIRGVREAFVTGTPNEILGQTVLAMVVPDDGVVLTEQDVILHCTRHLEDFKVPKQVEIRSTLPKSENGKIRIRSHEQHAATGELRISPGLPAQSGKGYRGYER
jgi:long-chain acyl-CoA synthetase